MSELRIRALLGLIVALPLAACAEAVTVAPSVVVTSSAPAAQSEAQVVATRLAKASLCADPMWKEFAAEYAWKYKLGSAGVASDRVPRDVCSPGSKVQLGVGLVTVSSTRFLQFRSEAPQAGVPQDLLIGDASAGWKGYGAAVSGGQLVTFQRSGATTEEVKAGLVLALELAGARKPRLAAGWSACGTGTKAATTLLGAEVTARRGTLGDGRFTCLWVTPEASVRLDRFGTLAALRDATLGKGDKVQVGNAGYYFPDEKVLRVAVSETELATVTVEGITPSTKKLAAFFTAVEEIRP
ncbi:MAG: hypothetical protein WAS07_09130 [Micropruina sp.]|nr:hypothetical protein [Micropruina sp.]